VWYLLNWTLLTSNALYSSHCFYGHLTRLAYSTPSNVSNWFKEHHVLAFSLIGLLLLELYRILFLSLQWQSEFTGIFYLFVLDGARLPRHRDCFVLLLALCALLWNRVVRNATP
jgi:hypothetical protein